MHRLLPAFVAVLTAGALVAGCGSSGSPSQGAAHGAEASKKPAQILADAAAALRSAGSYRIEGSMTELTKPVQRMRMAVSVYAPHEYAMTVTTPRKGSVDVIVDGRTTYMRADQTFWTAMTKDARVSRLFAGHWLELPTADAGSLASLGNQMSPSRLASCLVESHGTLTRVGTTTIGRRSAIVIRDAGNAPGDQPNTLAVAATGTPYPLKSTATGKQQPGGTSGECSNGSGPSTDGTLTLSGFGNLGRLRLPPHPINLKSLGRLAPQPGVASQPGVAA
jgi:hypothetical protein